MKRAGELRRKREINDELVSSKWEDSLVGRGGREGEGEGGGGGRQRWRETLKHSQGADQALLLIRLSVCASAVGIGRDCRRRRRRLPP